MTVRLTVCVTCKFSRTAGFDDKGRTGGEILLAEVQRILAARGADVQVETHECLWACSSSCTALVQAEGKVGYLAGKFAPDAEAAEALADWCEAYAASGDGEVDFKQWPKGMLGHFIARLPAGEKLV